MEAIIELEDNGQDALKFFTENDIVVKTEPFQSSVWKGSYIPVDDLNIGEEMLIHNPPNIVFGALKYKVKSIKTK